ncbi:DUF1326 domain-containing protein [Catalinimonas sp. 4WD22]|uniref:DUF1326 domain-containing protein n=1 Tax=Catalinimonas locisalis TaxID=3133978 RepID=UPI003101B0FC
MKSLISKISLCLAIGTMIYAPQLWAQTEANPQWDFNATVIEACSCTMFCQCFFSGQSAPRHSGQHADHHGEEAVHFCRFNMAHKVNKGSYNGVALDAAKYWLAGDLGEDFSQGNADWAVLTFDTSVSPEQREGIKAILSHIYPLQWNSFEIEEDADMQWMADNDKAEARLNDGKTAEMVLQRQQGMTDDPVVVQNIGYVMAPRNDGIILMPNLVEAYHAGDKAFEFKGTTGFMVTIDMTSEDVMAGR